MRYKMRNFIVFSLIFLLLGMNISQIIINRENNKKIEKLEHKLEFAHEKILNCHLRINDLIYLKPSS